MSSLNKARKTANVKTVVTHEGGKAVQLSPEAQLRRTLMNCLLWEDNFYESGVAVADRIKQLAAQVDASVLHELTVEARTAYGLRHAPLLVARQMARGSLSQRAQVRHTLAEIIRRPDEIAEFLSLYWADNGGKKFVSHGVRKGFELAMQNFTEYQFAKWDRRDKQVRIRDAMFMAHAKPSISTGKLDKNARRIAKKEGTALLLTPAEQLYAKVANDELKQTGTWEDRMSAGENPKDVFTDLMNKNELGALAFIRNVRKMIEAGVAKDLIRRYSETVRLNGVFPHQLLTSARVNKEFEDMFDSMLLRSLAGVEKLLGTTVILVDVSGSMDAPLSSRGTSRARRTTEVTETTRLDAACAVAVMARELCEAVQVFTFSDQVIEVPSLRGLALRKAIVNSQTHSGTYLANAVQGINAKYKYDRIIVVTDEQTHDGSGSPAARRAYMLNVAPYQHSVATAGEWVSISGWSPQVMRYIDVYEKELYGKE